MCDGCGCGIRTLDRARGKIKKRRIFGKSWWNLHVATLALHAFHFGMEEGIYFHRALRVYKFPQLTVSYQRRVIEAWRCSLFSPFSRLLSDCVWHLLFSMASFHPLVLPKLIFRIHFSSASSAGLHHLHKLFQFAGRTRATCLTHSISPAMLASPLYLCWCHVSVHSSMESLWKGRKWFRYPFRWIGAAWCRA